MSDFDEKDIKIRQLLEEKSRLIDLISKERIEREASKVPANFVQVSRQAMKDIRSLADKNKWSLKILMLFGERMNKQNSIIISQTALCNILQVTRPTVHKALKTLEDERWIKTIKIGQANAYVVNSQVFWTTGLDKKLYAQFSAMVVTTEEEQEQSAEDWDSVQLKYYPFITSKEERVTMSDDLLPPPDQLDIDIV